RASRGTPKGGVGAYAASAIRTAVERLGATWPRAILGPRILRDDFSMNSLDRSDGSLEATRAESLGGTSKRQRRIGAHPSFRCPCAKRGSVFRAKRGRRLRCS